MRQINWNEFSVLSIGGTQARLLNQSFVAQAVPLETCSRHLYVLSSAAIDLVDDAVRANPKTKIFEGLRAYEFLTPLFAGLGNTKDIDKELPGQLWKRWHASPQAANHPLSRHVEAMRRDGLLIFNSLLAPHLRRPTIQNVALDMAEASPEKKAVVIGGAQTLTVDLLCALGHEKRNTPRSIDFIHSDEKLGGDIITEIKNLTSYRKITSLPEKVRPEKIDDTLAAADIIFVCAPMSGDEARGSLIQDFDVKLCDLFRSRRKESGQNAFPKVIHLKGNPYLQGASSGPWRELQGVMGFFSKEMLDEEVRRRVAWDLHVRTQAREALKISAAQRMQQKRLYACSLNQETGALNLQLEPSSPPSSIRRDKGGVARLCC